ncbi:mRNA-capping enzyme [Phlebotomus argentipes]|uniref:mRNA-capping enzyme n=1 Tax=Phlebotomus argentipes TaxID=94469 RepID=UPI0028935AB0|nr:mRNA-capping enzyme [Phlebotomus argentipes]
MSRNRGSNPGPVPDRWLHCPRKSDGFIADRFLAFKTPLDERFDSQLPVEAYFSPEMVMQSLRVHKRRLGLWIDLTNTTRFYDRWIVESADTEYVKLQCRGHGETPSKEQTIAFIELVDKFIANHPLDIIGVHCTHGFNRTGFLIACYLVERLDFSVEAAMRSFSDARPPGIYKGDYIRELFERYDDVEDTLPPPPLPAWHLEYDDGAEEPRIQAHSSRAFKRHCESPGSDQDDSVAIANGDASGESSSSQPRKKKREFLNLNATFMAGVPGVHLVTDQPRLAQLQEQCQVMCNWPGNGFPGCQPVSMDVHNLKLLHEKPYHVSWKADGTRYMMLIRGEKEIFFFDRDHACFQVENLRFPYRGDFDRHLTNTLLDGEMVIDKVNGLSIPRYLVYDVVRFEDEDLGKMPFYPTRLKCIEEDIIKPRYDAFRKGLIDKNREPFSVRHKMFWDVTQARALLAPKFAKTLSHEPDGLIFQPSLDPYHPGQANAVLKWKPLDMCSVDFKLKIAEESGMGILKRKVGMLYVGQLTTPFAQIKFTKALKDLNNKIIECKFENNAWVFMRERTDKSFPNSYNTAVSVCNSIQQPVTTEMLLDFIDSEIMPPPSIC